LPTIGVNAVRVKIIDEANRPAAERFGEEPCRLIRASEILPDILPSGLFDEIIDPKDIGYTHPVFVQCFLRFQQLGQTGCDTLRARNFLK
jgi:hypothetical protein